MLMPFDSGAPIQKYRCSLPHWSQDDNTYFITFRLFDSLPASKLTYIRQEIATWKLLNPEPLSTIQEKEYSQRFTRKIHRWLDAGHGSCLLSNPNAAEEMQRVLRFFDGERYTLGEFVMMPNHVHALLEPLSDFRLESILHSWKSYSAKRINAIFQRSGRVWQRESFDHLVRSPEQLAKIKTYIRNNPRITRLHDASGVFP
jgi:REP element-mobilizing transposase RayT